MQMNEMGLVVIGGCLGGTFSLLGSLLANWLQYRGERKQRKQEKLEENLKHVESYVVAVLEFLDLVAIPRTAKISKDELAYEEWKQSLTSYFTRIDNMPVMGSARVMYVNDEKLSGILDKIDQHRIEILIIYWGMIAQRSYDHDFKLEERRPQLQQIAQQARERINELR